MLTESIIICALLIFMSGACIHSKKKYAAAIAPLALYPFMNIIACLASNAISEVIPSTPFIVYTAINILGIIGTAITVSYVSMLFESKKIRGIYTGISVAFECILCCIFIYNMYIQQF